MNIQKKYILFTYLDILKRELDFPGAYMIYNMISLGIKNSFYHEILNHANIFMT